MIALTSLFSLDSDIATSVAREHGYLGDVRIAQWRSPAPHCGLFVPGFSGDPVQLELKLRHAHPHLVAPIALWRELPPAVQESQADTTVPPMDSSGWLRLDSSPPHPTEVQIAEEMAAAFDLPSLGRDDCFIRAGGHSLGVLDLRRRLRTRFGAELRHEEIYQLRTPRLLAAWVARPEALRSVPHFCAASAIAPTQLVATQSQCLIYAAAKSHASSTVYNVPCRLEFGHYLGDARLKEALRVLARRHAALRSTFVFDGGTLTQRFSQEARVPFTCRSVHTSRLENALASFRQPFNLEKGPLWRACVFNTQDTIQTLLIDFHHLVVDGLALEILLKELDALLRGESLEPVPDYAAEVAAVLAMEREDSASISPYQEALKQTPLLPTRLRPDLATGSASRGRVIRLDVPASLVARAQEVAAAQSSSLHCFFLTVVQVWLAKLTRDHEVVIGVPTASRSPAEDASVVGALVKTMPVRHRVDADRVFADLLDEVTQHHLDRQESALAATSWEWAEGEVERGFGVVFATQRFQFDQSCFRWVPFYYPEAHFDFLVYLVEVAGRFELHFEYDAERFREERVGMLAHSFLQVASGAATDPSKPALSLAMLSVSEQHAWRQRAAPGSRAPLPGGSVVSRWQEMVEAFGSNLAIITDEERLTYAQVDRLSCRVASALRRLNVHHGDRIGLLSERRSRYVIAQLGILKVGATFVPLDPEYPVSRLAYMVEAAACRQVISLEEEGVDLGLPLLSWEQLMLSTPEGEPSSEEPCTQGHDVAYVMFTSGSTGRPKGVRVTHGNIRRLVCGANAVPLDASTRVLLTGSPSFDATTYEIWGPLLNGGQLVLVDKATLLDEERLRAAIRQHRPSVMWMTAPLFHRHVESSADLFDGVDYLIVGGDVVLPSAVRAVQHATPSVVLVNGYGPTENTTFSTFHVVPVGHSGPIPIGTTLAHSTAYVLDEGRNLLPPDAQGELYVGGAGVAAGYLDSDMNEGRFIEHTWPDGEVERLYRTGDIAWMDGDGVVRIGGRTDTQIKVRGYRVEPDEIREVLCEFEGVTSSHVTFLRNGDVEGLVAYVVSGDLIDLSKLRMYLQSRMPAHMVPTYYRQLTAIPLNANGKVATEALPKDVAFAHKSEDCVVSEARPGRTMNEQAIADIWRSLLPGCDIAFDVSFFELGGNSLKLVALAARLAQLTGVKPSISALYRARTVKDQARMLLSSTVGETAVDRLEACSAAPNRYRAMEAQSRLFLLDKVSNGLAPYLIPVLLRIEGLLDIDRARRCWKLLTMRHESLRCRFLEEEDGLWVHVGDAGPDLQVYRVDSDAPELQLESLMSRIMLGEATYRAAILAGDAATWLALVFHHAAFDGISVEVLLADFSALYRGETLAGTQAFSDVATSRAAHTTEENNSYWIERLRGASHQIQLPVDRVASTRPTYLGQTVFSDMTPTLQARVAAAARALDVTSFMLHLAVFAVVMQRYARQDDLTIGIVSSGRSAEETAVGMLASTLPLRLKLDPSMAFNDWVEQTKLALLDGIEHEHFSYAAVAERLSRTRESWGNPLFNVLFSVLPEPTLPSLGGAVQWARQDWPYGTAKFDLSFFVQEAQTGGRLAVEFAQDVMTADAAQRLLAHYTTILSSIVQNMERPVRSIPMLDSVEANTVLHKFNSTTFPYDGAVLLHQLFEQRAKACADATAVVHREKLLSYGELNRLANQMAHLLLQEGCRPGVPVLIAMDRSPEMIATVLAVLKAGAYYVPVDVHFPTARIEVIASTLSIRHMVADKATLQRRCKEFSGEFPVEVVVCVDGLGAMRFGGWREHGANAIAMCSEEPPHCQAGSVDLAYTIFTSGSTGQPKGVEVSHRPVVNLIEWVNRKHGVGETDRLLFVTSLCFDLSVYDIFGTLAAGAQIHIADHDVVRDPHRLLEILGQQRITFWDSAPAAMQMLVDSVHGQPCEPLVLRLAFLSGDWVPVTLPAAIRRLAPDCKVVALGGATEAAVWSNYFDVDEDSSDWVSIPYGRPIQNARYYVLDGDLHPCPIGVPGKLFIGGDCLARGYAGQPDLTAARFRPDPYSISPAARMYDTGDLARWRADGTLVFLGREDHQVKIRGYRVELGEISHRLLQHPAVSQALVLAQPDLSGAMALVAHVVLHRPVQRAELTSYLAAHLPGYMVPQWFSFLQKLPVTSNGKFDRMALASIKELTAHLEVEPETLEGYVREVHDLWCEVLGREGISSRVTFQAAGGDSLLIVRLLEKLQKRWPGAFTLPDLFSLATIHDQAGLLDKNWPCTTQSGAEANADDLLDLLAQVGRRAPGTASSTGMLERLTSLSGGVA